MPDRMKRGGSFPNLKLVPEYTSLQQVAVSNPIYQIMNLLTAFVQMQPLPGAGLACLHYHKESNLVAVRLNVLNPSGFVLPGQIKYP